MNGCMKFLSATAAAVMAAGVSAETMELAEFGRVNVVDTIDCTKTDHGFAEYPAGASKVVEVLGSQCRELKPQKGEASFFKYRLGKGKGLRGGGSYVVVVEYPEDVSRNYTIYNNAYHMHRSFATGLCVGDAYQARIVWNHEEVVDYPLSGRWEKWTVFTSLFDHHSSMDAAGRLGKLDTKDDTGFDIALLNYPIEHGPMSAGVCAKRIILCEIPDEEKIYVKINYPDRRLPRRHLFWREEMSDNGAIQGKDGDRQCDDHLDWFREHARQMKFLGMNTFCKEMLEFGHNQHWDPDWKAGRPGGKPRNWMWGSSESWIWEKTVKLMADYGFDIIPYYEYGGANGQGPSMGPKKRAEPLGYPKVKDYTHIWWSEKLRVDVTDKDAQDEFKYILDGTVLRFKDELPHFAGIWIRPRPAQMAVSFSDATRKRFGREANEGVTPSRDDLRKDKSLYEKYIGWWGEKRAEWCVIMRDYLEKGGVKDPMVFMTGDVNEPGRGPDFDGFPCEKPDEWTKACKAAGIKAPSKYCTPQEIADAHCYLAGEKKPAGTWGQWEWQHAVPGDDPEHYRDLKDVWLTTAFNRLYTTLDPELFDAYRNANGTVTMIRHYSLNEHMMWFKDRDGDGKEKAILGYAVSDVERSGRACMAAEINAMAYGDPVNIGYLMGYNFGRGFPDAVRDFNRNFLALPAMPSKVVKGACDSPDVFLREIDCSKVVPGKKYYALVHTGRTPKNGVVVRFPGSPATIRLAAWDKSVKTDGGSVKLTMKPWQLLAFEL